MADKIGFIGTGNMGSALAMAASKKSGAALLLSDGCADKARALAQSISASVSTNINIARECKYIFLAVKPQVMESVLAEIKKELAQRKDRFIIVTPAAGIKISKIISWLGFDCPVIRIMPNTPVQVGKGMVLVCKNELISDCEIQEFFDLMQYAGTLDMLSENLFDAGSALSGCGPAYVYMFLDAMANGAVECGLPKDKALLYAQNTLLGSAELLKQTKKHPSELKDSVTSPGGSTVQGVHALEKGAFAGTVMDCICEGFKRTKELGEQ